MASVDLGKAHVRVQLSDEIPGVSRDVEKMRETGVLTIGMDSKRMQNNGAYGVMSLEMSGESENKLASAMMPVPLFEPVPNYFWEKTNSPDEATTDVYWDDISFRHLSSVFKQRVIEQNPEAQKENQQQWKTTTETVEPLKFSQIEYYQSRIKYTGEGYLTEAEKKERRKALDADGNPTTKSGYLRVILVQSRDGEITSKLIWVPVNDEEQDKEEGTKETEAIQDEEEGTEETEDEGAEEAQTTQDEEGGTEETEANQEDTESEGASVTTSPISLEVDLTTPTRGVEEPSNSQFVRQYEALPSIWWGIQSAYFKEPDWPFWVTIRTHSLNLRNEKDNAAMLSIRLRDKSREPSKYEKRANGDNQIFVKNIEFIIDTNGIQKLHWEVEEPKANEAGKKTTNKFSKSIEIPEFSNAFREKEEIRVGFIPIMGRLCIFSNPSSYEVVQFTSSDQKRLISYGLNNTSVTVQGYGCTASIQAFPMTFYNHAWVSLGGKISADDDDVKGYSFPTNDEGDVKARSFGNGCFICAPTSLKEHRSNKGRIKYGGSFREYKEVLLDANPNVNNARTKCTIKLKDDDVGYYGMVHSWGKLHAVRKGKDDDFSEPFWIAYFGSTVLSKQQIIPGEDEKTRKDANRPYKQAGSVGFPYLVTVRSIKPKKPDRRQYDVQTSSQGSTEIIDDDIVDMSFTHELDGAYKPTYVQRSGSITVFNENDKYTRFLSKARGIKVWIKWGRGDSVAFNNNDLIFSGIAYGRSSSVSPGEQYITFSCVDQWKVLESFSIKNSPYYDGYEVGAVFEDIIERAGMSLENNVDHSQAKRGGPAWYFLGSGLRIFDQPKYRFNHSSPLMDCLVEVVKNFELYMYLDFDGVVHLAPVPGGFTWDKTNPLWNGDVKTTYFFKIDGLNNEYRLIIDSFEINSSLSESLKNVFLVTGVERVWARPILASDRIIESLTKPDDIGYLGYISELEVARPDLNSAEACAAFLAGTIKRLYSRPGFETTFKTIGHVTPYIPGEFIRIEQDPTGRLSETLTNKFRVTRIEHSYSSGSNEWTTSIGGFQVASGVSNEDDV